MFVYHNKKVLKQTDLKMQLNALKAKSNALYFCGRKKYKQEFVLNLNYRMLPTITYYYIAFFCWWKVVVLLTMYFYKF